MRARARLWVLAVGFAVAVTAALAWSGLHTQAFTDYELEAEPAVDALRRGDVHAFLGLAPAYGGSLILRAPFALLPGLWHGGALATYRMLALPALLAAAVLGLWLWGTLQANNRPRAAWLALAVVIASPLSLRGLDVGHPEELLGGALVAGAAVCAVRGRPHLTGVLLGLAVVNKPWALLAIVPVLLALPDGRARPRARALACASAIAAAGLLPLLLAGSGGVTTATQTAQTTGGIFQPWQAWWFLAAHAGPVHGLNGNLKVGYRTPPGWIGTIAHPLVVLIPLVLAGALALVRRRAGGRVDGADALGLLALTLLLRCLLDPWNTAYYETPFVLALLVWELHVRSGPPVLSAGALMLASLTLVQAPDWLSADGQAAAYLAWALPCAMALSARLLAPHRTARIAARLTAAARVRLPALTRTVTVR